MLLTFQIAQIAFAFITIILVLAHSAKAQGLGSIGGQAQMFKSSNNLEKGLNVATWIFGLAFLGTSAALSWGLVG